MRHVPFIGIVSIILLFSTGCGMVRTLTERAAGTPPAETEVAVAFDEALYAAGEQVYLENYCGTCHAMESIGTVGNFGPTHHEAGALAAERLADPDYSGNATTIEGYLRESIVEPRIYYTPGYVGGAHAMPAYTNLSDEDLDAVVYLLAQQGR